MIHSFWAGGQAAYLKELHEHYHAKLRDLRTKLCECLDDVQRTECETEIAQTQEEYVSKLKGIGQLLF